MDEEEKQRFLKMAEGLFPDSPDFMQAFKEKLDSSPSSPRSAQSCKNWLDAWVYIVERCLRGEPSLALHIVEGAVVRVVLSDDENATRLMKLLHGFAARFGPESKVQEIRLINCPKLMECISEFQTFFPSAIFNSFTESEWDDDIELSDPKRAIRR